jgi:hypothetical protein
MSNEQRDEGGGPGGYQRNSTPLWFVIGTIIILAYGVFYILRFWGGLGPGAGY